MTNHGNMYGPSFTFLGIPACDLEVPASYKGADVIIVGAPIDSGTSYRSSSRYSSTSKCDRFIHVLYRPVCSCNRSGIRKQAQK